MLFESVKKMFGRSESKEKDIWNSISEYPFPEILKRSENRPQFIYKHSNRCGVCFFAKGEVEDVASDLSDKADFYFLDVIKQREISNEIASSLEVKHESPQLICVENGKASWQLSHNAIQANRIREKL